ncbi:hypothetical protein O181_021161 [Austropuccinia psidii MF-1]|uniref:Uncharacterized protein n=1 Tax=Austropuccinia psidii MF-1 TaxID=1389203 RepID=A0A9Q3CEX7_9BASI|nr:hypothetical protein [Austropuccinia psidii MF-1]
MRYSESLIKAKKWTPIATQRSIKPQNSASIQGKPTLITGTGKITIINPVVTSKGKFPKAVDNKFIQGKFKGTLESQGTSQGTDKAFSEPEGQDTLDTEVDRNTMREIIPTLPLAFQLNRNLKQADWMDMDQILQLHPLLKDLFQWSMDSKRFKLASNWEELGESFQNIYLKDITFKYLMVITKGWNCTRKFRILEERKTRIRENQATIQAIEEKLNQKGPTLINSGSRGVDQHNSPVASHHSGTNRSVAKSHHPSQSQVVSRKRQGYKGKSKTSFSQRQSESDLIIQKLLELVKSVHKSHDALWLQMSQFAEETQKQVAELQESHLRMEKETAPMDKIVKPLQEGHFQLSKAPGETKRRLNQVLEEQYH